MQIGLKMEGLDKVRKQLAQLSGPELKAAQIKALNDTAFEVRRKMQEELRSRFDRPTPFIVNSPKVFPATVDKLFAIIQPTQESRPYTQGNKGGKIGVDPAQVLHSQQFGGSRRDKKSEVLLRQHGWLPMGYQTAIPATPFPGSVDAYGNLKGGFVRQVLGFLQAASEQGSFQNMKAAGKANLKAYGSASKPKKTLEGPRLGRTYFVAGGQSTLKIVGGDRMVMTVSDAERTRHLQRGIWAKLRNGPGSGKGIIKPVILFVKTPFYQPRVSMERIAKAADADNYLAKRLRFRIRQAAGV